MILKLMNKNLQKNFLRSTEDKNLQLIKIFLQLDQELECMSN
jgi:hypothetical protein